MIAPKGRLLDRRPGQRQSRDTEGGRSLPKVTEAILKTLKYSDHFNFPLTLSELHLRLTASKPCTLAQVSKVLSNLLSKRSVARSRNFYYLPGHSSVVAQRLARHQLSTTQQARASVLAGKLGRLPGVLAVYLTGSLAMANSAVDDDIDFMIITHSGRLWTTRLLLTIYTSLLGLRRTPHSTHNTGKLCLNLYLTPASFSLPPHKQSLYTAYELIQATPLYDPLDTRAGLLSANPWIYEHLPNLRGTVPKRNPRLHAEEGAAAAGRRVLNGILNLLESLAYRLQFLYMRPRLTREYITRDSAFFHPHNPAPKI